MRGYVWMLHTRDRSRMLGFLVIAQLRYKRVKSDMNPAEQMRSGPDRQCGGV